MATESATDVVFRQPQIISEGDTILPAATLGAGGASCGTRPTQSGAVEMGRRLLLAARAGDTSLVLDLMAKGAPFTNDWLGTSPLHLAASNAHTETCGVLLRAGVSREARTKVERTPLHLAAYAGHADVTELLLQHGAQVDCRDMLRMTPLHWAAERGHTAVAAALLRHGADPRATNKFRKTPLQLAAAHPALVAMLHDELRLREAAECVRALVSQEDVKQQETAKSVRTVLSDRPMEETAASETARPVGFIAVHKNLQDVKINPQDIKIKPIQEKAAKTETKTEKAEGGGGGGGAGAGRAGAAALLRRHGITLLPADDTTTVLNALQSGRTVVLSDAGKLMLKESSEPAPATAVTSAPVSSGGGGKRGMVLTATPVRTTPLGVKVFTVNNRLSVTPTEVRPRAKIMTPQDLQHVKIVQLPPDARLVSPRARRAVTPRAAPAPRAAAPRAAAPRAPVKIIMNKSNFERLVAGAKRTDDDAPVAVPAAVALPTSAPIGATQSFTLPGATAPAATNAGAPDVSSISDAATLRALLAQAHDTIASLTQQLDECRARLALLDRPE